MSWIQPDSTVRLFSGIPLDHSYENCIYFSSRTACTTYFSNLNPKYELDNLSYIRHSNNKIKVSVAADNILDCNYLCFQNTAFGNKWFYAFILDVEYTNNNSSIITYEIDVINTYLWDCAIGTSYIIRQHSVIDTIGSNIVDEPFTFNGYKVNKTHASHFIESIFYICGILDADDTYAKCIDHNFIRGKVYVGFIDDMHRLVAQHQTEIAFVAPIDTHMVNVDLTLSPVELTSESPWADDKHNSLVLVGSQPTTNDTLDGYTPKNNKLYTAPFNMLRAISTQGDSTDFRYEFFGNGNLAPSFYITSNFVPPLQYVCRPYNYTPTNEAFNNYDKAIYLDNTPSGLWSIEQYRAWQESNGRSNAIQKGIGAGSGALAGLAAGVKIGSAVGSLAGPYGTVIGGVVGGIGGAVGGGIAGSMPATLEEIKAQDAPDTMRMTNTSSSALYANGESGFAIQNICLNANELEIVDNFLTRYGYAQNRLAVPNLHARPKWTYIKCNLTFRNAPIPTNANEVIRKIFDNGTTFWTSADYIGHYELDNSPA